MVEYGTIRIKLDELIKEAGLSKNKLSHRAETVSYTHLLLHLRPENAHRRLCDTAGLQ